MNLGLYDQTFKLNSSRSLFWQENKILLIADLHLGKITTFQKAGIFIPEGVMEDDLAALKEIILSHQAERCIIVGDLIHARCSLSPKVIQTFQNWLEEIPCVIELVLGNHDRSLIKFLPKEWNLKIHLKQLILPPFCFCHIPYNDPDYFVISGHIHPQVILKTNSYKMKFRCFQVFPKQLILPAFSDFVGGFTVQKKGSEIYAIIGDEVIKI